MSKTTRKRKIFKRKSQGINLKQVLKTINAGERRPIKYNELAIVDIPNIISIALVRLGRLDNETGDMYRIQQIIAVSPEAIIRKVAQKHEYLRNNTRYFFCRPISQYAITDPELYNRILKKWDAIHLQRLD